MIKFSNAFAILLLAALACGCGSMAPRYSSDFAAIPALKAAHLSPVNVKEVTKSPTGKSNVESLTIRGGQYKSPYGSFTAYLREALREDLDRADLLDAHSPITIEGVLIRNEIDASGFTLGFADIQAQLIVKRDGRVAYDQTKSARHEWRSNFVGAVAIPRAIESYPVLIRKLLGEFYVDPNFLNALKKQ